MGFIKNYQNLATTDASKMLLDIAEAGLAASHPRTLAEKALRYDPTFNSLSVQNNTYDIIRGRIFVVGGGKAAGFLAEAFEKIVGIDNIEAGIVNCEAGGYKTKKIKVIEAGHPLPDKQGARGVEKMLELKTKHKIGEKDLVVCLLSGGGSSLMPAPAGKVSLKDKQETTRMLLESGAVIREINAVRKHLSITKGGQLGGFFSPAKVVSILISDIAGNDLSVIASGPTTADPTTFLDARGVLEKYRLLDAVPAAVKEHIEGGCAGLSDETPKKLDNCDNFVIGDVKTAMEAMAVKARSLGLRPLIASAELAGETEQAAIDIAGKIEAREYAGYNLLLFGGETTPKLPPRHGQGGRSRHYAAVSMYALGGIKRNWSLLTLATDGADGQPDAAGVLLDEESLKKARGKLLPVEQYITDYNTEELFKKMGENQVVTGHTGTNVGDIAIYLLP